MEQGTDYTDCFNCTKKGCNRLYGDCTIQDIRHYDGYSELASHYLCYTYYHKQRCFLRQYTGFNNQPIYIILTDKIYYCDGHFEKVWLVSTYDKNGEYMLSFKDVGNIVQPFETQNKYYYSKIFRDCLGITSYLLLKTDDRVVTKMLKKK